MKRDSKIRSNSSSSSSSYNTFKNEMKSTIDAAALQNNIAQKYSLPGSKLTIQKKSRTVIDSNKGATKLCSSCLCTQLLTSSICTQCGYFMNSNPNNRISLAQHRGLIKSSTSTSNGGNEVESITQSQWIEIEKTVRKRCDGFCPICMEGFNQGFEILLSCSHVYHRSCIQSFEKIQKDNQKCCPLCRTNNYHKKVTNLGTEAYRVVCSIRIQSNWRGHFCRVLNYELLREFYSKRGLKDSILKKKFLEKEVVSLTNRWNSEISTREGEVRDMFRSMDKVLSENRQLDLEFELMMANRLNYSEIFPSEVKQTHSDDKYINSSRIDYDDYDRNDSKDKIDDKAQRKMTNQQWKDLLKQVNSRELESCFECAICMSEIIPGNRRVVLLNCSHLYHQRCIMNLENFIKNQEDATCPLCRNHYERKLLNRTLNDFDNEE